MYIVFEKHWWIAKNYNKIWDKVSNTIKKGFDREPVWNKKCLETIIKSYEGKVSTNFHNVWIPNEGFHSIYLGVILIDSDFKTDKKLLPTGVFRIMKIYF